MKRILPWILGAALVLLTLSTALAIDIHYTNWGGGLSPNTWGYGTTALTMSGDAYRMSYYQDQTRMFGSVNSVGSNDFGFAYSASRPTYTNYHTYSNSNLNYRTYSYGGWQTNYAQAQGSNWGFQTQGSGSNAWGTAYYGGYVSPVSGGSYGPTTGFTQRYPSNGYGYTTSYYGSYNTQPYNYNTNYYRYSPSTTISRGSYYY